MPLAVKASRRGRDSQLVCDSHEQIFNTATTSHSRISWLESSNSRVGISRETSSHILHPVLSSASARVASSESRTSATCTHGKRLYMEILKINYNSAFLNSIATKIES